MGQPTFIKEIRPEERDLKGFGFLTSIKKQTRTALSTPTKTPQPPGKTNEKTKTQKQKSTKNHCQG